MLPSRSLRIPQAVGLSSTTSACMSRRSGCGRTGLARGTAATPNQAVKVNVLPTPRSLSTPISPPIISVSRFEMESPRPVPPYWRVVVVSACVNAWKRLCLDLGEVEDVVDDAEQQLAGW